MSDKLRLGIFGGSFDPVHCGHLQLALAAYKEFDLDQIVFVPARKPPHKKDKMLTPARQRVKMLSLAIEPYPCMSISFFELRRKTTTYSYQTARYFRRTHPDTDLYFIIGSDSLEELHTWKRSDILRSLCHLVVGRRKGGRRNPAEAGTIPALFLRHPLPKVSSSDIRQRIRAGKSVRGLMPPAVERYIADNDLYRTPD